MTQDLEIRRQFYAYLDHCNTKSDLYDKVEKELQVPRPTIRRVASHLRKEISRLPENVISPQHVKLKEILHVD